MLQSHPVKQMKANKTWHKPLSFLSLRRHFKTCIYILQDKVWKKLKTNLKKKEQSAELHFCFLLREIHKKKVNKVTDLAGFCFSFTQTRTFDHHLTPTWAT